MSQGRLPTLSLLFALPTFSDSLTEVFLTSASTTGEGADGAVPAAFSKGGVTALTTGCGWSCTSRSTGDGGSACLEDCIPCCAASRPAEGCWIEDCLSPSTEGFAASPPTLSTEMENEGLDAASASVSSAVSSLGSTEDFRRRRGLSSPGRCNALQLRQMFGLKAWGS